MRTFILGLGAQKAGTTWLFKQLIKSERFARGFSKEYHLFDALHLGSERGAREKAKNRINNYPFHEGENFVEKHAEVMGGFYEDVERYYDYFDQIIDTGQFSLDITPSYSGLDVETLAGIREGFEKRGIAIKVVYFLREPITRAESSIKMALRRAGSLRETQSSVVAEKIRRTLNSPGDLLRSDYQRICGDIDAAFEPDDVFYGFYETLFSPAETRRLGNFLRLPAEIFDEQQKVNVSPRIFRYTKQELAEFRSSVEGRYQFVRERFGFNLDIWDQAVAKLRVTGDA